MLIEIACYSLEAAVVAARAGADRIELCAAPAEGGITPSAATMKLARKYLSIPIHVMIRPREGDFCYSDREFESMLQDMETAKSCGLDGVVAGILLKDGAIDVKRMKKIVELASPMNVTCHRAFDMSNNPLYSLENLIDCGVQRILTSGGMQTAPEGFALIDKLVEIAGSRISIMPGSGIHADNIRLFAAIEGIREVHLSAKTLADGPMEFRNPRITMGGRAEVPEYGLILPDEAVIGRIKNILQRKML
jgi:copper homeostasis protein